MQAIDDLTTSPNDPSLQLTQFAMNVAAEAMYTVAPDGRFLNVNEAACERLDYTRDELLNMSVADIDPHYPADRWPSHFEELRARGKMRFETQHRAKSGKVIDVEVSVAYFEFAGKEYCCSSVRDISKQKRAEQIVHLQRVVLAKIASTSGQLSETLSELCRLVQESVPGALATIMLIDPNDGCLRFESGPSLTDEIRDAFGPIQPGETAGSCGAAAFLKEPVIVEDTRCSPYWQPLAHIVDRFHLHACWSLPLLDECDEVLGTFAISHQQPTKPNRFHRQLLETASHLASIAIRRQRFEEQLRLAHEELAHISRLNTMGEMASSFSHELNQPLAAIVNYAYVLEHCADESPDMSAIRRHVASIREQAMRAGEIVTSVRNMARRKSPSRSLVCLNSLIHKSLVMLEPEMRQMGVKLKLELDKEMPPLHVDEVQIQQILVNLIRNALDAMQPIQRGDRRLTITTQVDSAGLAILRVADSGSGLPADQLESVFEPFQTTKPDGMGMGLAICRSIAERHEGRLFAEATDNGGAVFHLVLPTEAECSP